MTPRPACVSVPAERERAALLFYAPPTSALARTLARLKSETALRKAGYRPTLVTTPADLARVASTTWDVVLVDAADGGVVKQQIPASGRAQVVAVLAGATAIQTALARAEFPVVLKSPSRNQDLLDALDAAAGQTFANHAKAAAAKGR